MTFLAGQGAAKLLKIYILLTGTLVCLLCITAAILFSIWILTAAATAASLTVFAAAWYAPRYVKSIEGYYDSRALRMFKGVWWQKEILIPMPALRTFEYWLFPLGKRYDCGSVVLRFAGGMALLPLLCEEDAARLINVLKQEERIT